MENNYSFNIIIAKGVRLIYLDTRFKKKKSSFEDAIVFRTDTDVFSEIFVCK